MNHCISLGYFKYICTGYCVHCVQVTVYINIEDSETI